MKKTISISNLCVPLSNLLIDDMETLYQENYLGSITDFESLKIDYRDENNVELVRKFRAKNFLPEFLHYVLPNHKNLFCYTEYATLEKKSKEYHVYNYEYKPDIPLYEFLGTMEFYFHKDTIEIILNSRCTILKNVILKRQIEKRIEETVNTIFVDLFRKIEKNYFMK